jgi:hypothetical protein
MIARADYAATNIEWKGWQIASSENLYAGRIHRSYPLTYLLDGGPRTAWVFSGKGKCKDGSWNSRYALEIRPDKPVIMDRIRLMNGYNKSRELFFKNDRVIQIRLTINGEKVKTATLADTMGWHEVAFPRQAVNGLRIEFTGIRRGQIHDLCISELALYNGARKVEMHMPQAVMFTEGSECG